MFLMKAFVFFQSLTAILAIMSIVNNVLAT
jgi:hypothetical protein